MSRKPWECVPRVQEERKSKLSTRCKLWYCGQKQQSKPSRKLHERSSAAAHVENGGGNASGFAECDVVVLDPHPYNCALKRKSKMHEIRGQPRNERWSKERRGKRKDNKSHVPHLWLFVIMHNRRELLSFGSLGVETPA